MVNGKFASKSTGCAVAMSSTAKLGYSICNLQSVHSCLSAAIGSTLAARRAGM
jgi:hypothetical protein